MKNRSKEESHKNVKKYKHIKYKIYIFGIYMAVMAIISTLYCMIPVRRAENQEQFPAFTIESIMNGEYFRYIELWYNNRFLLDYRVFEEKAQGYELVTVSKLAQTKGYNLEAKVIYSEFPFHNSN